MGYANAVLLGNTKTFHNAYYIAAGNSGGLKQHLRTGCIPNHYIAAGNSGGLKRNMGSLRVGLYYRRKRRGIKTAAVSLVINYIAAGNGGGLKEDSAFDYIAAGNSGGLKQTG